MGIRISNDAQLWSGGRLPFEIDTGALGATGTVNVNTAIDQWNLLTPFLRLTPHNGESNFVVFQPAPDGAACNSPVGIQGGEQYIQCHSTAIDVILHEIGHAAGFWHEQSRSDRDSFVTINTENIDPNRSYNFDKHVNDGIDLGEYDYNSLMHYGPSSFAKVAGIITIVAPTGETIGEGITLSAGDLTSLQLMYENRVRWTHMIGELRHVSTASANEQWGVNPQNQIFRRDGNAWTHIDGTLKQISVGADGTVWGVNPQNQIFRRDGNAWTHIDGTLKQISVGADGTVWGVNPQNQIFRRDGNAWTHIDGTLKQISVGADGTVWGVNPQNQIFRRDGNAWTHIDGTLKQISVGTNGIVLGVNPQNQIFLRDVENDEWEVVGGVLSQISVAADGSIWGVNPSGNVFRLG